MRSIVSATLVCVLVAALGGARADTIVGNHNTYNSLPFSSGPAYGLVEYQQVYASSAFPGPITIGSVYFFGEDPYIGQLMDTGDYTISFSVTSAVVNGLSSNLASNIGTPLQTFGTFHVEGNMPSVLTFVGTPFSYDPGQGNLLMDVTLANGVNLGAFSYFQADNSGSVTSRAYNIALGKGADRVGLVTGFGPARAEVPEIDPASTLSALSLAALGLGLFSRRLRRAA